MLVRHLATALLVSVFALFAIAFLVLGGVVLADMAGMVVG